VVYKKYTYYVYVLQGKGNKCLYKGVTNDLKRRLKEHNSGNVPFTKNLMPWELVYYEAYNHKEEAEQREKYLKSSDGKKDLRKRLTKSLI